MLYTVHVNEEETKLSPNLKPPRRPTWRQLFKTTEVRILLLGIAVGLVGPIVMGIMAFGSPATLRMIAAMSFTNIMFGWVASMSIGYAGGYGHALVVPVNLWVETVLVLVFYPLFVFSMRKLVVFPSLKRFLDRTRAAAEHPNPPRQRSAPDQPRAPRRTRRSPRC